MLEADYLVVGAGALGMAFVDQLLTDTDATVIIVDRRPAPGGHWVDTYPFVRLHQPSAYYGVGSMELGSNRIDESGFNKGCYELASGPEMQAYFESLMRERFLPSGRVQYFPCSDYSEDGRIILGQTDSTRPVRIRKRMVDATRFTTCIPATHPPQFEVEAGIPLVSPNLLPETASGYSHFTIVGGGKTAMDVAVWLLAGGIDPGRICWIVPRDSWLINRETVQPGDRFHSRYLDATATQLEICAEADSIETLFRLLEEKEQLLRIDRSVRPAMFHSATLSKPERDSMARIGNLVRMGRVRRIGGGEIELEDGRIKATPRTLYVNCSASGLTRKPGIPIYEEGKITIQMVRAGQFCLSAAVIAHMEARNESDETRNELCRPIALPDSESDWLTLKLEDMAAQRRWAEDGYLRDWVSGHRLSGANLRVPGATFGPEVGRIRSRIKTASGPAAANLSRLLERLPG